MSSKSPWIGALMPCANCKTHRTLAALAMQALHAIADLDEHTEGCVTYLNADVCGEFDALYERAEELRHDALCGHPEHLEFWASRFKLADDIIEHAQTLAEAMLLLYQKNPQAQAKGTVELAGKIRGLYQRLNEAPET